MLDESLEWKKLNVENVTSVDLTTLNANEILIVIGVDGYGVGHCYNVLIPCCLLKETEQYFDSNPYYYTEPNNKYYQHYVATVSATKNSIYNPVYNGFHSDGGGFKNQSTVMKEVYYK